MTNKVNCWEFKQCGREPNGAKAEELGICPAAVEGRVDGVNGGENGGRCCWVVAQTLCNGKVQGRFAGKFEKCRECAFYVQVRKEEGSGVELSIVTLDRLRR